MSALDQQYLRRREIEEQLARIVLDENGTPISKLPDCPSCENDEIGATRIFHGERNLFRCNVCRFFFECSAPAKADPPPQSEAAPPITRPIGAELDAFFAKHSGNELIFKLYRIYRRQVSESLATVIDVAACGEVKWAESRTTLARNEEIVALRHMRAVLERKDHGHG